MRYEDNYGATNYLIAEVDSNYRESMDSNYYASNYSSPTPSPSPTPTPTPTPTATPTPTPIVPKAVDAPPSIKDIIDMSLMDGAEVEDGNESIISTADSGGVSSSAVLAILAVLAVGGFILWRKFYA